MLGRTIPAAALAALPIFFIHGGDSSARQGDTVPAVRAPDELSWRTLSPGLEMATVSGDPMAEGKPYSVMLRLASGRWIAPHWHPNEKVVAVMSGTLLFGHGETLDSSSARVVGPGGTVRVPATARHYEGARGQTLVLLTGLGPLRTNPVRAGDDAHGTHR
jgi:hypothetical protein